MEEVSGKDIILTCKSVWFYSKNDENAFYEWLKKIDCIDEISAAADELYLHIASSILHDQDLRDLLAIFYRYKVDMKQLARFLTPDNKKWFYDNKKSYWHKQVFGSQKKQ